MRGILARFFVKFFSFLKSTFWKTSFRNTIRVSNSLDPDQARRFVGPDLDPNCLQRLSADDTSRQRVNTFSVLEMVLAASVAHFIMHSSSILS